MQEYFKDFDNWNNYKKSLDGKDVDFQFMERQIWWCALGVNVGSEQDGKNEEFVRPVLILKKISRDRIIILPITSKILDEVGRITITVMGKDNQLLLSQIRAISSKRLLRLIQKMKTVQFQSVVMTVAIYILEVSLQSETPPDGGESRVPEATVETV